MSAGKNALTAEDIARLKSFIGKTGDRLISGYDCGKMREDFRQGVSRDVFVERYDVNEDSIRRHLAGDCSCATDVAPIETDEYTQVRRLCCWADGCAFKTRMYDAMTHHWNKHHAEDSG